MTVAHAQCTRGHVLMDYKELEQYFHNFISWIERNTKLEVVRMHTNNAPEFITLRKGFERIEIVLTSSSAHTPQSNRLAEHINRTLLDRVWGMLQHPPLDERVWGEALKHTADLHNHTATPILKNRTPLKTLLRTVPNMSKVQIFGCAAYVHIHKESHKVSLVIGVWWESSPE